MDRKNGGILRNEFLNTHMGRRALLKSTLLGGGAATAGALFGGLIPIAAYATEAPSKYEGPVVETASGKIRGVIQGGTHTFRGIPYAASTAGSNRFMPPRKPEPWSGVREVFQNGPTAPQLGGPANAVEKLMPACKSYSTFVTVIAERPRMANVEARHKL